MSESRNFSIFGIVLICCMWTAFALDHNPNHFVPSSFTEYIAQCDNYLSAPTCHEIRRLVSTQGLHLKEQAPPTPSLSIISPQSGSSVDIESYLNIDFELYPNVTSSEGSYCVDLAMRDVGGALLDKIFLPQRCFPLPATNQSLQGTLYVDQDYLRNSSHFIVDFVVTTADGQLTASSQVFLRDYGLDHIYVACSSASIVCCVGMFVLYVKYPKTRQFPSSLAMWRVICDFIFSLKILVEHTSTIYSPTGDVCSPFSAFLNQFSIFGSLCWYFTMSINLYFTVSDPFKHPRSRNGLYHVWTWTLTVATSIIGALFNGFRVDLQLCWVQAVEGVNTLKWITFHAWIMVFFIGSVAILIKVRLTLSDGGFRVSISQREKVVRDGFAYTVAYSVQWGVLGGIYLQLWYEPNDQVNTLYHIFCAILSLAGVFDFIVFLITRVLRTQSSSGPTRHKENADELSKVLRNDFVRYTVLGILESINDPDAVVSAPYSFSDGTELKDNLLGGDGGLTAAALPKLCTEEKERPIRDGDTGSVNSRCHFVDCAPAVFRSLRQHVYGVSEQLYEQSFCGGSRTSLDFRGSKEAVDKTVQLLVEKFSEGKSGSFFYITTDMKYFVKTLTPSEHNLLLRILPKYYAHMRDNADTLICRFFGCHKITLFNHTAFFVVMENVLYSPDPVHNKIQEKYDLKGSWVARHAKNPDPSKGVLKDMDLHKQITLKEDDAVRIMDQIYLDCEFFASCNIMDYSLLLGIHNCREERAPIGHCNARLQPHRSFTRSFRGIASLRSKHGSNSPVQQSPSSSQPSTPVGTPRADDFRPPSPAQSARSADIDESMLPEYLRKFAGMPTCLPFYRNEEGGIRASCIEGPGVYFLGIVDCLQEWNWDKRLERWAKCIFKMQWRKRDGLSAIPPRMYADRFARKMRVRLGLPLEDTAVEEELLEQELETIRALQETADER